MVSLNYENLPGSGVLCDTPPGPPLCASMTNLSNPFIVKVQALKTGVVRANARHQLIAPQEFPIVQNWDFATEELFPSTRNNLIYNRMVIFS
jgi:hypothetical protein